MRILITGAFGFVGSWLTKHLATQGHEVFAMSRNSQHNSKHSSQNGKTTSLECNYQHLVGDISNEPELIASYLPDNLDSCIHAASFNEHFLPNYPRLSLEINGLGTRNMLEALRLKKAASPSETALSSFVYLSTFHVYGVSQGLVREGDPAKPRNDYALSHLVGEEYCRYYTRVYGLPTIIPRLSNGYGAPKISPFGKWYLIMHDLCKEVLQTGTITLRSDPNTKRDFVWLGDVAHILETFATKLPLHSDLYGQVVNVASGKATTLDELVEKIAKVYTEFTGKTAEIKRLALASSQGNKSQFSDELVIDNLRLKGLLEANFEFTQNFEKEIWDSFEFLKTYGAEQAK